MYSIKGRLRINNPETRATLCTRHRMKTNKTTTTTQKTKKMNNTDPIKNMDEPWCTLQGMQVHVSHKTLAVLLI